MGLSAVGMSWIDRTCTSPIQININISVTSVMEFRQDSDNYQYRKSPTSTVSTSKIFSSMNFIALGIKFVPVELLCSKICTRGN